LYQKAETNSEGSATIAVIRLDNNSNLQNKLTIKDLELITEATLMLV
jgi:hypothetical protein